MVSIWHTAGQQSAAGTPEYVMTTTSRRPPTVMAPYRTGSTGNPQRYWFRHDGGGCCCHSSPYHGHKLGVWWRDARTVWIEVDAGRILMRGVCRCRVEVKTRSVRQPYHLEQVVSSLLVGLAFLSLRHE